MIKKRDTKTLASRWLAKAEEDFGFASVSLSDASNYFSQICFWFQQAAEKFLKAFLVFHNYKPPRIHSIETLIQIAARYDSEINQFMEEGQFLTPIYIRTRYDVQLPSGYTREDAEKAQEAAKKIGDFVKEKLRGNNNV